MFYDSLNLFIHAGKGLGKCESGIADPIKVKIKNDTAGVRFSWVMSPTLYTLIVTPTLGDPDHSQALVGT